MHEKELLRKSSLVQKYQQCLASHITWSVDRAFLPLNQTKWCKVMQKMCQISRGNSEKFKLKKSYWPNFVKLYIFSALKY